MQWINSANDEPLPLKYLRAHFSKLRSSRTKTQNNNQQQFSSYLFPSEKGKKIISQLDHQLQVTYNKIRQQRNTNSFSFQDKKQNLTQFIIENRQESEVQNIFSNLKYNTVKQYVHYIYQNYNLQDPLENVHYQTPTNKIQSKKIQFSTKRQSNTSKKISSLKNNFREELNSQPTVKKEKQTFGRSSLQAKRQTQISQFYLQNSNTRASNILNHSFNFYDQKNHHSSDEPIKQQFRYCFMCGQAILTANIKHHQNTCENLKSAYKMSGWQLIQVINSRIKQIKQQISKTFLKKDRSQLVQMVQKIQYQMQNGINVYNQQLNEQQVKIYEKISQSIQKSKILKVFQLMSRLKWFSYIKINMQKKQNLKRN